MSARDAAARVAPRGWRERLRPGLGARLLLITLAILAVDFTANSLMFERAQSFLVESEEVGRAAEHLVVARRVLAAAPPEARAALARRVSTHGVRITWLPRRPDRDPDARLPSLRAEAIAAQGELAGADPRLAVLPLSRGGGMAGSVLLPDGSALQFRSNARITWSFDLGRLLHFSLPSLVLFSLAWWLVRSTVAPLQRLVGATRQVGTDEMVLLPETGQSEVRELIRAFNRMHQRIHQLLTSRTQTLLAVGHDLRTPLARLQLRVDGVSLEPTTRREMEDDITEMSDLLASLQAFVESGEERGAARSLDLAAMVRAQLDAGADAGFVGSYAGPDSLEIRAHPTGLRRAIANLLQNAWRYAGAAEVEVRPGAQAVEVIIADRGPGIPEDWLDAVRQPFTRLDSARARDTRGMGLGLAIVDRVVQAEGGRLSLENRPGGGLAATIHLPL